MLHLTRGMQTSEDNKGFGDEGALSLGDALRSNSCLEELYFVSRICLRFCRHVPACRSA